MDTPTTEQQALDLVPASLEEAEAEHGQIMQRIQQRQQQSAQMQQENDADMRRGIFLEGVMAAWPKKTVKRGSRST